MRYLLLAIFTCLLSAQAVAENLDPQTQWVIDNLRSGQRVDFNKKCNTGHLAIPSTDHWDPQWMDKCRTIDATIINKILLMDDSSLSPHGLYLIGANINGSLDFESATIKRQFTTVDSILNGNIVLARAKSPYLIGFDDSYIVGNVDAYELQSEGDFYLFGGSRVGGTLDMRSSLVSGFLDLGSSHFRDVIISNAQITRTLELSNSEINGKLYFNNSKFAQINMVGAHITSSAIGSYARVSDRASFNLSSFDDGIMADRSVIGGVLTMQGAKVKGRVNLENIRCDAVLMRSLSKDVAGDRNRKSSFENVDLSGAAVERDIDFVGAKIDGSLNLDNVKSNQLFLRSKRDPDGMGKATFHDISLRAAHIATQVDLSGADVVGEIEAQGLNVGETLFLDSFEGYDSTYGNIDLSNSSINGDIQISTLNVNGYLRAENIHVQGIINIFPGKQRKMFIKNIDLSQAHIGILQIKAVKVDGSIDLHGAQLTRGAFDLEIDRMLMAFANFSADLRLEGRINSIDLSDANIGGDLRIDVREPSWTTAGDRCSLDLDRAHVAFLSETTGVWPATKKICMGSLKFVGFGKEGFPNSVEQDLRWWAGLMERDKFQTLSPYYQLTAIYQNAGDRDDADYVRYARRVRERQILWANGHYMGWALNAFMAVFIGYGIGKYAITSIILWIVGLSLTFGALLFFLAPGVRAASRGPLWCFGASLTKLVPGVELHKEFTDFFEERSNLGHDWMSVAFASLGLFGWLVGAVLIATVVGLGQ